MEHRAWSFSHVCAPTAVDVTASVDQKARDDAHEVDAAMLEAAGEAIEEEEAEHEEAEHEKASKGAALDEVDEPKVRATSHSTFAAMRALPRAAYDAHKLTTYQANVQAAIESGQFS
ncbi:hypothetical protein AB1Y20_021527 [Prymnesium parvum]|uniref:Ribosome biogenesis protein NOP53 n=1 Tax=Prymnesium parvum TaxID=97485 RepID=A0AB34JKE2_PRYPA|mmetsp:Transcript_9611/g.23855  ORF Transcript_9611/g.23855 Transcript_9611/m.23855 type:complete len:117 (+) Transcript_9611:369-719(+)